MRKITENHSRSLISFNMSTQFRYTRKSPAVTYVDQYGCIIDYSGPIWNKDPIVKNMIL